MPPDWFTCATCERTFSGDLAVYHPRQSRRGHTLVCEYCAESLAGKPIPAIDRSHGPALEQMTLDLELPASKTPAEILPVRVKGKR
jgi:hypothetical protein